MNIIPFLAVIQPLVSYELRLQSLSSLWEAVKWLRGVKEALAFVFVYLVKADLILFVVEIKWVLLSLKVS